MIDRVLYLALVVFCGLTFPSVRAEDYQAANYQGDDYIKYWTEYAILPKRCIVHDDVDVIVYSVFEQGYKQCADDPMGTYITPVGTFLNAYLNEVAQKNEDAGNDDYEAPYASFYTDCTLVEKNGNQYYVKVGCTDGTSQSISVNIYKDNQCETRDTTYGSDDSNIDATDLQLPFKQCQQCVNWVDRNDDNVDDQYYENREMNAPLCSGVWAYKETCDRKCQKMGLERNRDGWNTSDKILLSILGVFGTGMLIAIVMMRRNMSTKDALLEEAAITAAGLQQGHVIAIFVLVIVVITVFALLNLKNITWFLLLIMNTVLFGYLMKLTIDSGVTTGETVIGPDGTVIHRGDSDDDSSVESGVPDKPHANNGTYDADLAAKELPAIT